MAWNSRRSALRQSIARHGQRREYCLLWQQRITSRLLGEAVADNFLSVGGFYDGKLCPAERLLEGCIHRDTK
eukprot:scaffold2324_cov163-Ochromonas_danica.AAC.2